MCTCGKEISRRFNAKRLSFRFPFPISFMFFLQRRNSITGRYEGKKQIKMRSNIIFQERSEIQKLNKLHLERDFHHFAVPTRRLSSKIHFSRSNVIIERCSSSSLILRKRVITIALIQKCIPNQQDTDSTPGLSAEPLSIIAREGLKEVAALRKKSETIAGGGAVCASTNYSKFSSGRRLQLLNGTQALARALEESVPNRDFWTITSFIFLEVRNCLLAIFISN